MRTSDIRLQQTKEMQRVKKAGADGSASTPDLSDQSGDWGKMPTSSNLTPNFLQPDVSLGSLAAARCHWWLFCFRADGRFSFLLGRQDLDAAHSFDKSHDISPKMSPPLTVCQARECSHSRWHRSSTAVSPLFANALATCSRLALLTFQKHSGSVLVSPFPSHASEISHAVCVSTVKTVDLSKESVMFQQNAV